MANHILLAVCVQELFQFVGIKLEITFEKAAQVRGSTVAGIAEDLEPVARRQDHAFFNAGMFHQLPAGLGQARLLDSKALAHFHWSRFVVHANELELHEATNLWIELK